MSGDPHHGLSQHPPAATFPMKANDNPSTWSVDTTRLATGVWGPSQVGTWELLRDICWSPVIRSPLRPRQTTCTLAGERILSIVPAGPPPAISMSPASGHLRRPGRKPLIGLDRPSRRSFPLSPQFRWSCRGRCPSRRKIPAPQSRYTSGRRRSHLENGRFHL